MSRIMFMAVVQLREMCRETHADKVQAPVVKPGKGYHDYGRSTVCRGD